MDDTPPPYQPTVENLPLRRGFSTHWEFLLPISTTRADVFNYCEICTVKKGWVEYGACQYFGKLEDFRKVTADECRYIGSIDTGLEDIRKQLAATGISVIRSDREDGAVWIDHEHEFEDIAIPRRILEAFLSTYFENPIALTSSEIETELLTMKANDKAQRLIDG